MRLGLYYDLRNPGGARSWARVYAAALDRIGWADRAGIGAIWVTEHHGFADGYLPAPLTFCAAIATRTSRARIGTAVVVSPLIPRPLPVWVGARGPRGARLAGRDEAYKPAAAASQPRTTASAARSARTDRVSHGATAGGSTGSGPSPASWRLRPK